MSTLDSLAVISHKLMEALLDFPDAEPKVAVWEQFPHGTEEENEVTYQWGPREASEAFARFLTERGIPASIVHAQDSPVPFHSELHWVRTEVDGRVVNVDWTARQFYNLEHPPQPVHADLPCPMVWLTGVSFPADAHPVTGKYGTVTVTPVEPGRAAA
jgi:hypothetical protein